MDAKEFEVALGQAERRLKKLRTLYEQYFQGLERIEPQNHKRDLDHLVGMLRRNQPNNTALRFRFTQIVQRYTTYNTYWRRITRQIEEGTYRRDVLRARRITKQEAEREEEKPKKEAYELDMDLDVDAALDAVMKKSDPPAADAGGAGREAGPKEISRFAHPSDRPGKTAPAVRSFPAPPGARPKPPPVPPKGAAGKRPPPPPVPGGRRPASPSAAGGGNGITDAKLQQIHQRYVEARRKNNERVDNVKIDSIAKSVNAMMPKLQKKHAGKKIDFEVVVKNGKVALKPVAK